MANYNSAGIYTERLPGGSVPVAGVPTATLVVYAYFPDGLEKDTTVITSWPEFERKFGGVNANSDAGFAIRGFFDNGGQRVIPFRVCAANAAKASVMADTTAGWRIDALYKGAKYTNFSVVLAANADTTTNFDITVKDTNSTILEVWANVSFASTDTGLPTYVTSKVNPYSAYINFVKLGGTTPTAGTKTLAGGTDGTALATADIVTACGAGNLDRVIDENIILIAPDNPEAAVVNAMIAYATTRKDCFVIACPAATDITIALAQTWWGNITRSQKSAAYWPYITIYDELRKTKRNINPVGHLAGIYARTDANKNVGKNPAGTVDGALQGIVDLAYVTNLGERDTLYGSKINPLIKSSGTGMCVWGARTGTTDPEWIYINHERLFQFVEKALYKATPWIAFENNTDTLRLRVYSQVNGFLSGLHNDGYFAGKTPSESFFVICDRSNNPDDSVARGELIVDVGIAPAKPAEFIRLRFRQKTLTGK